MLRKLVLYTARNVRAKFHKKPLPLLISLSTDTTDRSMHQQWNKLNSSNH